MNNPSIVIVGAGPAGLAIAGRLRKKNIPFVILEQSNHIANSWYHHYDRLCLHTVKQYSALPHMDFPADYPLYVPRLDLIKYYENYAAQFDIKPVFNCTVTQIKKKEEGQWLVSTNANQEYIAEKVIIATGVNRVPFSPSWDNQNKFTGDIIHSRKYRNPDPFIGKKTLVIGMGNTGAEIALDLANHDVDTYLSVRSAVNIIPRDINGRATQITGKFLEKIPLGLGDWLGNQIRRFVVGDLSAYGLETAIIPPATQLKLTGKTPVLDLGTVKQIKAGKIKVLPDIKAFLDDGQIQFANDDNVQFDAIILATGYKAKLADFLEQSKDLLIRDNLPDYPIAKDHHEGLYFIGFDNYKLGGILGTIIKESELIANHIEEELAVGS